MELIKIDDNNFKEISQVETMYNIVRLKNDKKIILGQINRLQERINKIDAIIQEAIKIGIANN